MKEVRKLFIFTNIAPHYRASLWLLLLKEPNWETHFFYGFNSKLGIKSIDFTKEEFSERHKRLHELKNYWLGVKFLVWQIGVISQCLNSKPSQAIFLSDMYCLSTWLGAIICRLRGIQVAFWGHGLYGNENKLKLLARKTFYHLADRHLLYERRAKNLMVQQGFNPDKLYVVFNSLDYDRHKKLREQFQNIEKSAVFPFLADSTLPVIVFIGRLTVVKKLNILLNAVSQLNSGIAIVNLVLIGDGPERQSLKDCGKEGLEKRWLHFTGVCYDEKTIGRYISSADLCVSPGNVGLTAIHSLSFGTPVCTHINMKNQMPEAEAISEGYNGCFFNENDVDGLASAIKNWLETNTDREKVRKQCYEIIDDYYNPYYQLTVFRSCVKDEVPEF